jgi:GNAT superfamily N-acetyltransferase
MDDQSIGNDLSIHLLAPKNAKEISEAFSAIGWSKPVSQYERYFLEQEKGERTILVARLSGDFGGYVTILWHSNYIPFRTQNIPEIQDLNVLPRWRRQGIATRMMEEAESRVVKKSPVVGLGVGMDRDYGPAQHMYALRGYIPDGLGLTYAGRNLQWGESVRVDDSLVLYMTKSLRP